MGRGNHEEEINSLIGQVISGTNLSVLEFAGRDKRSNALVRVQCSCGTIKKVLWADTKRGKSTSCSTRCTAERKFQETEVGQKYNNLTVTEYVGVADNRQIICKAICDCGKEWEGRLADLKRGRTTSCSRRCTGERNFRETEIGKKYGYLTVTELVGWDGTYCICKAICDCGNEWVGVLNSLKSGLTTSCGCRTESKGEEAVRLYLEEKGVDFVTQYTIHALPHQTQNHFIVDFFIPSINVVIEYHGRQHYEDTGFHHRSLADQQHRDGELKDFCETNDIKFIEIPYTKINNIAEILRKGLAECANL